MTGFTYKNGTLFADNVAVRDLAAAYGTPCYIYCSSVIGKQINSFKYALENIVNKDKNTLIAFACKANSNLAILNYMGAQGCGCDVVSGGEMARALAAGIAPEKIVFSGVGKTDTEIESAITNRIHQINVESLPELSRIIALADHLQQPVNVAFRMNPDVEAGTHEKITTGRSDNKFGMLKDDVKAAYKLCETSSYVTATGLSIHIGSQLTSLLPYKEAFEILADFVHALRLDGYAVSRLDLGGGLGVIYDNETPIDLLDYAAAIKDIIVPLDTDIILEPGRYLTANAGILLSRVIYEKISQTRRYLILDAGMNDLMRPALYDAYHAIKPIETDENRPRHIYDIVGPVCETGDTFAKSREIQECRDGDYLAIFGAGAYGAVMASNYNTRSLPAEVMVSGDNHAIIRKSQDIQDILDKDIMPHWAKTSA